jgi:hypothetical protein
MILGLEITHHCNKNCALCDHRIRGSSYQMSREDVLHIADIAHESPPSGLLLTGGEPLLYHDFDWLVKTLLNTLPDSPITVMTNGALLDTLSPWLIATVYWEISEYPGFNDEQVRRYRDLANVTIKPARPFWDPYRDPDLDEATARLVRVKCLYQARVLGRRLYGCCLSESIERYYETEPAHVSFDMRWQDLKRIPTWRTCQHCFRAIDWRLI